MRIISVYQTGSTQFQGVFVRVEKIVTVITLSIWTDRHFAYSVDQDQTPQFVASDQGLHCLPYIQQYLDTSRGSTMDYNGLFQILGQVRLVDKVS